MSIWTRAFWTDAAERAISTTAQAGGAYLMASATGILEVDWVGLGSVAGLAGLLAVLKAVAASRTGDGSASLVGARLPLSDKSPEV